MEQAHIGVAWQCFFRGHDWFPVDRRLVCRRCGERDTERETPPADAPPAWDQEPDEENEEPI
jgi:hypothetical protein